MYVCMYVCICIPAFRLPSQRRGSEEYTHAHTHTHTHAHTHKNTQHANIYVHVYPLFDFLLNVGEDVRSACEAS